MAESTILENPNSVKLYKSCRCFKINKIKNLEAKSAKYLIKEFIDKNTVLHTDNSTTFSDLSDCINVHIREISGTNEGNFNLKWVHISITNLKKHLQTNHMITERMMHNYLDEFYYKLNIRYFVKGYLSDSKLLQVILYWYDCR